MDKLIAAVEVALLVAVFAAVAPRGKLRIPLAVPAATTPTTAPVAAAKPARAPTPALAPVPAPVPAVAAKQFWGVVDSIDAASRALAIKDKHGRLYAMALSVDVQVTVGGENKPAALVDLKPGDNVTVTAQDGAARLIHVRLLFPAPGSLASAG